MSKHILCIDDESTNLLMLEEFLSDRDFQVTTFQTGREALRYLGSGVTTHAILLDRMMPEMNGMQVLEEIKKNDRLSRIPVIMQTAAAAPEQVAEGIAAGVFYYLTKPFSKLVLLSILDSALRDYQIYETLHQKLHQTDSALARMESCSFTVRTLDDVASISFYLAGFFPQSDAALMGLKELMINAVEHGNLGIGYAEKTELNRKGRWEAEVARRLSLPENRTKVARVTLQKKAAEIMFTVEDQGGGFDWQQYMEMTPSRALDNHGRGIAMSKLISFDEVTYLGPGNKVVCKKSL